MPEPLIWLLILALTVLLLAIFLKYESVKAGRFENTTTLIQGGIVMFNFTIDFFKALIEKTLELLINSWPAKDT
ncbi:MAG: hypothetical protein GX799_05225 [Crenarchaeota archaeon]|nr:hypothetical protein [Thermoproteota archaeon]